MYPTSAQLWNHYDADKTLKDHKDNFLLAYISTELEVSISVLAKELSKYQRMLLIVNTSIKINPHFTT
jgi:hypothetical protein